MEAGAGCGTNCDRGSASTIYKPVDTKYCLGDVIRLTGANRNTLKQHFRALVERAYLSLHGSGR
jgi:hypothetical protein